MIRVVLTAGFDRALHVLALAELLVVNNHEVAAILVVNPFSLKRLKSLMRQRGVGFIKNAMQRLLGGKQKNQSDLHLFLQENNVQQRSLKAWAKEKGVHYLVVPSLNDPCTLEVVRNSKCDGVLYGGGGILKQDFIESANHRILNAHSGPLPEVRGMNACEWSILLGLDPKVTIHYIDKGIDTGAPVKSFDISVDRSDTIDTLREKCTIKGVQGMIDCISVLKQEFPKPLHNAAKFRQCYVMAPAIKAILGQRVKNKYN